MQIDPKHVTSLRNEYSLVSYGPRCFAIICGPVNNLAPFQHLVSQINAYNPHRVFLRCLQPHTKHTSQPFLIVEMKYKTQVHQMYFICLIWYFSKARNVWIHMWDTLEHDCLRRDFETPEYMDAELSINRLWLRDTDVYFVDHGHDPENPHGEYVQEITLQAAMDCLSAGKTVKIHSLSIELESRFGRAENPHMIDHVRDVSNVYVPRALARLLICHPSWIEDPDFEFFDPTCIVMEHIPPSVDLTDEIAFIVAVSDPRNERQEDSRLLKVRQGLSSAQWISLMIKVNANKAFHDAKDDRTLATALTPDPGKNVSENSFQSAFLMEKLHENGLCEHPKAAKLDICPDVQLMPNWSNPVNVLGEKEAHLYTELERENWDSANQEVSDALALVASDTESYDDEKSLSETTARTQKKAPFFSGLEDTTEFSEGFIKSGMWKKLAATVDDPSLLENPSHAFSEDDLHQTADLEDFDDFVEFYARQYLGYTEEDLEKHRVGVDGETEKNEQLDYDEGEKEPDLGFDWLAYNDDSDYDSG